MPDIFLIGGGWREGSFRETYGRFLAAARSSGSANIAAVVADDPDVDADDQFHRFLSALMLAGLAESDCAKIVVGPGSPLTREALEEIQPTGMFVCGGLTPLYQEALCRDTSWSRYLEEKNIPYCGFSAGAAIAGSPAIVGGWKREVNGRSVEVSNENTGEDLEFLDIRDGLGLVPFAIDVHAAQWGTVSRLIHAVDAGLVDEGWAIDENTMLHCADGRLSIFGNGCAYRARAGAAGVNVEVLPSGSAISYSPRR